MIRRLTTTARPWPLRSVLPAWRHAAVVVAIAGATLIAYLYVVPNSEISASRVRIGQLKAEVAALERENADLLAQIALYSDLNTLEARAKQLGLGPARGAVYLMVQRQPAGQGPVLGGAAAGASPTSPDPGAFLRQLDPSSLLDQLRDALVGVVDRLVGRFANR